MSDAWRGMSAADLGRGIGQGDIDPCELTEVFLEAIAIEDRDAQIYARTTPSRARAEAGAARDRARAGARLGPLDGVPISWKDLFDTAGTATESGTALLQGRVPGRDAVVLRNASSSGLVCLGKTHQTELAFSGLGLNPVTATPPCINDPEVVPGGSSSGAAASVAFGLAAVGIGSDTGGSVRIPSAWNDLVGLKTTSGRLPLDGVVPLVPSFDTAGPLCRSVEDAALVFAALEGGNPADLHGSSLTGRRFAVLNTVVQDDLRAEAKKGFQEAVGKLSSHGAEIVELYAAEIADAMTLSGALFAPEAYATWGAQIEANPDAMFAPVRERFQAGREVPAHEAASAWRRLRKLRAEWELRAAPFDAVLMPTTPIMPPKKADLLTDHAYFVDQNLIALRNTRIGNLMGLCVLTLPTGVPSAGISLMGKPFQEEALLRLGIAAEAALA
jgi:aspartyl-tRNA(Asn)/glutamyl-tRNA(Gln) amidotransferase subunit A